MSISKIYIESMNRACYPINTQMNSNICNASIFTNSFISNPNNRVRIQDENHKKQINTCLIKEDNGIYWYIYKFCVIICIKLNSSSLQVLYLYKRGELLMNQRKSLKELNLLDKFLFDEAMDDPENVKTMLDIILLNTREMCIRDRIWTGNRMLDMILNQKTKDAKEKETDMQIETEVFATLPFSDREIISLFGNVLDNALEACERIQDKKRWIKIKIKKKNHLLYIEASNAIKEMPVQNQKEFVSVKEDEMCIRDRNVPCNLSGCM